jgi:hypothetical protein
VSKTCPKTLDLLYIAAAAAKLNGFPSTNIQCMITPSLQASAFRLLHADALGEPHSPAL